MSSEAESAAETEFYSLLDESIANLKPQHRDTFYVTQDKYQRAIAALLLPKGVKCPDSAQFKFWCNKNFTLHTVESTHFLYCKKTFHPVATKEEIYDIIKRCHEHVGHGGRDKTWEEVRSKYSWIRFEAIVQFLKTCSICSVRQLPKQPQTSKPSGFLTQVQIHLIDMTSRPDGEFKSWILQMRDECTRFSWTHPLVCNHPRAVAEKLLQTFSLFGFPRMLQSDNRPEFITDVIQELKKMWPGIIIIQGHPRYPKCVEHGSEHLQKKLGIWLEQHPGRGWSQGLSFVTYAINTSSNSTTNKSPYEEVFGQPPRTWCSQPEYKGLTEEIIPSHYIKTEINQSPSTTDYDLVDTEASQVEPEYLTSVTVKSVCEDEDEHELYHEGSIVATGTDVTNQLTVHGMTVGPQEGIFQISSVLDEAHVPERQNPFKVPLQQGQYAVWSLTEACLTTQPDTSHSKVRKVTSTQQSQYNEAVNNLNMCELGESPDADLTDTHVPVLPCKVE